MLWAADLGDPMAHKWIDKITTHGQIVNLSIFPPYMHGPKPYFSLHKHTLLPIQTYLFPLQPHSCNSLLQKCPTLKHLKQLHAAMLKSQLHHNLFFSTKLITNYTFLGSMSYAFSLFSIAKTTDLFLYNVLIRGFAVHGPQRHAISLYHQMRKTGKNPDNFTFPHVFKACSALGDLQEGREAHEDARKIGFDSNSYVGNSLIAMYGKCGSCGDARQVLDEMPKRNLVSWNSMIGAYVQNGFFEEAVMLLWSMEKVKLSPNRITILNLIPAVCDLLPSMDSIDRIYSVVVENGFDSDICVRNSMMGMFAKCGRIEMARKLFDGMREKDLIAWSSVIQGYAEANLPLEALELFKQTNSKGIIPDHVTMLTVVRVCSNHASLQQARIVHGLIIRSSFDIELILETALVDMYVKCGSLKIARKLFDRMPERNIITWSTMISGYGMHGQGKNALKLFDEMKNLMKPDDIAFVSILSACSHSGLIADGWRCFDSMIKDFGITPRSEHYACMVDLMGRGGQLEEAKAFIKNMPVKPDAGVWGALLGACRIHSNVKLAELAAKSLFELDPRNSGRYVLLANIYAASGNREEALKIRTLMKHRGVKKNAGHTVVEVENKMFTFLVGDRSHPKSDSIYRELARLIEKIKEEGYAPDTNFVFDDVEEEMKENMLYVHSEKLAIVFGLMNSKLGSQIRIIKNLRVCGDCHTATKFISKATSREIVMRDSQRFHHFEDGACSCGDYW